MIMNLLWFVNVNRFESLSKHNGGGWISSLESLVRENSEINLSVAFVGPIDRRECVSENVFYHQIGVKRNGLGGFKYKLFPKKEDAYIKKKMLGIINETKPDLIHVFGTEYSWGKVVEFAPCPVIVHLQGIISAIQNSLLPPGYSKASFLLKDGASPLNIFANYIRWKNWKYNSQREKEILRQCNYFCGRTKWDKALSRLFAPASNYFHIDEALRDVFYEAKNKEPKTNNGLTISSVISSPLYKGGDVIVKCSKLLDELGVEYEWNVFGINNMKRFERKFKYKSKHVKTKGKVSAKELCDNLLQTDVFVHPSYIDNSPNSVCEAQMLGIPIIACNVGGVSSIVEDGVSGILVSPNDPYMMVSVIMEIYGDEKERNKLSANAKENAMQRHNKQKILSDLLSAYNEIIK